MPFSPPASSRWSTSSTGTCRRRLQDRGGFANPEVVGWFTDYAGRRSTLGDRVNDWMTFNEPAVFAFLGHADGIHAPGLAIGRRRCSWPTTSCAPMPARRGDPREGRPAQIGVAIDVNQAVPATDSDEIESPPAQWSAARDAWFLDPLFGRGYPELGLDAHRGGGPPRRSRPCRPPAGRSGLRWPELLPARLVGAVGPPFRLGAVPVTGAESHRWDGTWRPTGCASLARAQPAVSPREIVISENGAAYPDKVEEDGRARDQTGRPTSRDILRRPRTRSRRRAADGYYVWSLLDNYEWSLGYTRGSA